MSSQSPKSPQVSPPERRRLPALFILTLALLGLLALAILILSPFLGPLVLALVLAVIGRPFFTFILRRIGEKWRGIAAGLSCAALLLLTFAPLTWIGWSIASETPAGVRMIRRGIEDTARTLEGYSWFQRLKKTRWFQSLSASVEVSLKSFHEVIAEGEAGEAAEAPAGDGAGAPPPPGEDRVPPPAPAPPQGGANPIPVERVVPVGVNIAGWITRATADLIGNALEIFLKFCLMVFILYYFLKDGPQILGSLKRAIPVDETYQDRVVETFRQVSRSIIRGSLGTAAIQGAMAALAFLVVGVPAVFWGVLVAISSLIPPLGTSLIMIPITGFLFLGGHTGKGIFMALMTLAIGGVDNIVRPLLVGRTLSLHPIWLLLSVLGALAAFGPMGLIYGPMVLVLLGTIIALLVKEEGGEAPRKAGVPPPDPPIKAAEPTAKSG